MIEAFVAAVSAVGNIYSIGFVFLGCSIGLLFGAVPGLGGVTALALVLPLTFGMDPLVAMIFYAAVMGAVPFGGSISAILLNTPGTAPNAATCLDGHPMSRRGEGNKALGISATASGLGALFGVAVLLVLLPVVRKIVLLFGPPEFLMLVLVGLATVALAARGNLLRGLMSGGIGILISLIGYSLVFGNLRFDFGSDYLFDGIELVPFLIGIFAVSELINYTLKGGKIAAEKVSLAGSVLDGVKEVFRHKICFFRSSAIGTCIGIIPGVGGTAANFIAYITAKESSKHPETFGTGDPEGVVAAESANNAKDGGALLPTVGFGIPGSAEMAVLLGGFILHGLAPGPMLIKEHLDIVFALLVGLVLSNVIASTLGLFTANYLARVTLVDIRYITPVVLVLCFVGSYVLRGDILDVLLALVSGIFGYGLLKFGFSPVCLIIGFILGDLAERAFHQSLMISRGSYMIFFNRTAAVVLLCCLVLVLVVPFIKVRSGRKGA